MIWKNSTSYHIICIGGNIDKMKRMEIQNLESFKVATMRVKNPRLIEEEFEQLLTWLKQRGIQPRKKLAIFYDNLYKFDNNHATKCEACFIIKETVEGDEIVQIKELPPKRVVTTTYEGSYEAISSVYKTLLHQAKEIGYVKRDPPSEVYIVYSSLEKDDSKDHAKLIQFPIEDQNVTQTINAVFGSWMFPHFFVVFQWALLLAGILSFLNFAIITPGSRADGSLKIVMLSHLWVVLFSIILSLLFYKNRHRGIAEKAIFGVSTFVALFSAFNLGLYFVDDFLLLMRISEIVTWILYLVIFGISIYKIMVALFNPLLRKFSKS